MEEKPASEEFGSGIIPWIAVFSVLTGLVFLAAWIFRLHSLLLIYPGAPIIHINTCLNFIVAGMALWFGAKRRMTICSALGSVNCVFCGLVLAEFLFHGDWGMQRLFPTLSADDGILVATKMGPDTALCFLLLGSMFLLLGLFPKKPWSHVTAAGLGGASMAITALGLLGYLFGTESLQQWLYLVQMSLQSAVGLLILGLGTMGLPFRAGFGLSNRGFWVRSLPFAGLGSITATLILTQAVVGQNHRLVEHVVAAKATEIQRRFQSELGGYTDVLERIALRKNLYGAKPMVASEKEWEEYRKRYPAFLGMAWSDKDMNLQGSIPREGVSLAGPGRFIDGEKLSVAKPKGVDGAISWLALADSGWKALTIAVPCRNKQGIGGYLVGLVGAETLLENILNSEVDQGYKWGFYLDGVALYTSGPPSGKLRHYFRENNFFGNGHSWRLTVYPTEWTLRNLSLPFAAWMLGMGLFSACVLSLSVFLAQLNHDKVRQLQQANLELQDQKNLLQRAMTAQTEAEEASRKNRELLHTAVSNAPIIFSLLDKNFRYQLSLGKGLEARGQKEGELVGQSALELYSHLPGMTEMLNEVMSGKQLQITAELGGRIITAYDTPLFDAAGQVEGIVAISMDVTDRVKAEEALRESEERFRALIQHSHDVIQLLSREGVLIYTSPSITPMLGYTPEEALGRTAPSFMHSEEVDQAEKTFGELQRNPGKTVSAEIRLRHKDGTWHWMEVTATNLLQTATVGAIVVNLRDITDRKQAEQEIRRLKDSLEFKVEDRTAQLASVVLELEAFSYSISHDLRAPLRHIGGFVALLQAKSAERLDANGLRYLEIIAEAVQRMDGLISHLLAFSRMSRQELQKSHFSMDNLVKKCLKEMELDLTDRKIAWSIGALPEAFGDPALIRQALSNLLSNAVKFTKNREETGIEIGSRPGHHGTVYYVRDNGIGFDMKYVDKLFGVFQRLHSKNQFEGTGIGLANVRRIVERHGGKAWAEGMDGEGATFYFSLPDT